MSTPLRLHFVVPGPLDQRTGGYIYDARVVDELRDRGWDVVVHSLDGRFPDPDDRARSSMESALEQLSNGELVVVDGLALEALTPIRARWARRLRLIVLVHHLVSEELGEATTDPALRALESSVLRTAAGVIVTSPYTASRVETLGVEAARVRVVEPGTAAPPTALPPRAVDDPGTDTPSAIGGRARSPSAPTAMGLPLESTPPILLCVGTLTPRKGQDRLIEALARIADQSWTLRLAGSLDRDPEYATHVRRLVAEHGLESRIEVLGECDASTLERLYADSDLFVLASRFEGYGMALTEAMVRGLPVLSTTAGAIPATVPVDAGVLVPPDDIPALAGALSRLVGQDGATHRSALADGARRHALGLPDWPTTGARFDDALRRLAGYGPPDGEPAAEAFPMEWLALREPADHRARSEALASALRSHWSGGGRAGDADRMHTVVDLGAGTGSNPRWLAPRLEVRQRWILVDRSAPCLAEAERRPPPTTRAGRTQAVSIETRLGDLGTEGLAAIEKADLVTASALLDLVSMQWLDRLVARIAARRCPALFALTYDGRMVWADEDPDDGFVRDAVNAHQRRDKGLGPALGPHATSAAVASFEAAGYDVTTADTPWRLGRDDAPLTLALLDGWRAAARDQHPEEEARIEAWAGRRLRRVRAEGTSLEVGHTDVLALPPS